MKAVGIVQFGDTTVLKELELPLPEPNRQEVRIRIRASGFNPIDVKARKGIEASFPMILGIDCSGIVDAVGDPFGEFEKGDEVVAIVFNRGSNGTNAEYVVVPTAFVAKKPKRLSFEQAASIPFSGLTAFQGLIANGALQEGRSLFLCGGSEAIFAIPLARAYKVDHIVIAVESDEAAEYFMRELNIPKRQIIPYRGLSLQQIESRAIELNRKEHFATTFDVVGGEMKKLCFSLAAIGGHVVTTVLEEETLSLWSGPFTKTLSVHLVFPASASLSEDKKAWNVYKVQLKMLMQLIEREEISPPPITVLEGLSVKTVSTAHSALESKVPMKLVMQIAKV